MSLKDKKGFSVVILAGGYATRLYPITLDLSKPLLKIDKRAIIDFSIQQLEDIKGIKEIIVVTNAKFYSDYIEWKKNLKIKNKVVILNDGTKTESSKLGAVGDIYYAIRKRKITDDVLVIGGDNIFQKSLANFVNFSQEHCPAISLGIYDLKSKSIASRYGIVKIDNNFKVIDFQEKPQKPATSLAAMCMYYFSREALRCFKEYIKDLKKDTDRAGDYIKWLMTQDTVYGFKFLGAWWDIGQLDTYREAQAYFSKVR